MQEEGIAAAAAGHLDDQLVVVVADLAQLRALVVAAAHPAAIVSSLGPQELQDGVFHRRPIQYRTGKPGSSGWATQFGMRGGTSARRRRAPERAHPLMRKRGAQEPTPRSAASAPEMQ